MKPGDVVLVAGRGWIERMIEWATDSPYSHAALVGNGHLIEATFGGVHTAPLGKYPGADVLRPRVASGGAQRAVEWAEAMVGQPYGWRDIVWDAERDLLHLPVGWRWRHLGHRDCSALVAAAWASAGVPLTFMPAPSPGDLGFSAVLAGPRHWQRP